MEQNFDNKEEQQVVEVQPVIEGKEFVIVAQLNGIETIIPIEAGQEMVFGGSPECDSCLDDKYMSSKHFKAKLVNGCLEVEDLGSTNGLYQKIQEPTQLEMGCHILAGKTIFSFEQKEQQK